MALKPTDSFIDAVIDDLVDQGLIVDDDDIKQANRDVLEVWFENWAEHVGANAVVEITVPAGIDVEDSQGTKIGETSESVDVTGDIK